MNGRLRQRAGRLAAVLVVATTCVAGATGPAAGAAGSVAGCPSLRASGPAIVAVSTAASEARSACGSRYDTLRRGHPRGAMLAV